MQESASETNIIDLETYHTKVVSMFSEIELGEEIYVNMNFSRDMLPEDQYSDDSYNESYTEEHLYLPVLSSTMLDFDQEMFNSAVSNNSMLNSRPYFCSFNVPLNSKNLQVLKTRELEWYAAELVDNSSETDDPCLTGILCTSASPVNYYDGKKIKFKNHAIDKNVLQKINSTYDCSHFTTVTNSVIQSVLSQCWGDDTLKFIDIYNVGHANADYIHGSSRKILFDIGYNYRQRPVANPSQASYPRATNALRNVRPDCVVLSHWDEDHYIGCAYAKQQLFTKPWIAPKIDDTERHNPNIFRLVNYINHFGKIYFVERPQNNAAPVAAITCRNGDILQLWIGDGKDSHISVKNREGLIIEIEQASNPSANTKSGSILLAADVPYKCLPHNLNGKNISFLHVPHHCSKMDMSGALSGNSPVKGICGIISTNRKKDGTIYEDHAHYTKLQASFNNVIHTIDHPKGDQENLAIRINYRSQNIKKR